MLVIAVHSSQFLCPRILPLQGHWSVDRLFQSYLSACFHFDRFIMSWSRDAIYVCHVTFIYSSLTLNQFSDVKQLYSLKFESFRARWTIIMYDTFTYCGTLVSRHIYPLCRFKHQVFSFSSIHLRPFSHSNACSTMYRYRRKCCCLYVYDYVFKPPDKKTFVYKHI